MLDHYIPNGIPLLSDQNVLTTLVTPYKLTDKIGEKIIGIAKTYNTVTLDAYVNNAQIEMNADFIKYRDELCKSLPQLLFDYIDYVTLTCDKKFNVLNNTCYSEINIKSDLPNNTPINILLNIRELIRLPTRSQKRVGIFFRKNVKTSDRILFA